MTGTSWGEPSKNGFTFFSDLDPVKVIINNKVDVERSFAKAYKRIADLERQLMYHKGRSDDMQAGNAAASPVLPSEPYWILPTKVLQVELEKIQNVLTMRKSDAEILDEREALLKPTWDIYRHLNEAAMHSVIPRAEVMAALAVVYGMLVDNGDLASWCDACKEPAKDTDGA